MNLPTVNQLNLNQKIAQMIMVDFPDSKLSPETKSHLQKFPWGGVILFARNIENRRQLIRLNQDIMATNPLIPPYISVDQEGGLVNRAEFDDMHLPPGNMALGKINDPDLTRKTCAVSGVELRELGFHLNFAPVVDVNINPQNPIIGVRSYGENPEIVSVMGAAAVAGYEDAGIASCAKHFPGHGDTSFDSHLALAAVEADERRIRQVELPPFKSAIDAGAPSIMTAHVVFPAIDPTRTPATLSRPILTGLLREEMGFEGLIITDSMSMKAISENYGVGESAVLSVLAGADIVMMVGDFESQVQAHKSISEAVGSGRIPTESIDKSVERILNFKKKYVVNPPAPPKLSDEKRSEIIREACQRAASILYDGGNILPLDPKGKNALLFSPSRLYQTLLEESCSKWSISPFLKGAFSSLTREVYDISAPQGEFFAEKISQGDYGVIFLEIYSRGMVAENMRSAAKICIEEGKKRNIPTVIISLSSPYGIPQEASAAVTGFNYSPISLKYVAKLLLKES